MGLGTVISGMANDHAALLGAEVHGISQAFQRSAAGATIAIGAFLLMAQAPPAAPKKPWRHKKFWLVATALVGPVAGVSCYQWAQLELHSSAIVVAIAATSTLLVIPLARIMERDAPGARQILGTLLAAGGIVALKLFI
jgi:drug/metabolite transporter (DMT)-like permease